MTISPSRDLKRCSLRVTIFFIMQDIKAILSNRVIIKANTTVKPRNINWEQADEFAKYVGFTTPFVMRLFKTYGKEKVLSLKSWIKDLDSNHKIQSITWKLKQVD